MSKKTLNNPKEYNPSEIEETFGMIKFEAMERNLIGEIEKRIYDIGLTIEEKKQIIMTLEQFNVLYAHTKEKRPKIYESLKEYMTKNPVIVMRISGINAVETLLALRGSSNPKDAKPGTIRGDYAKDQDYAVLYDQRKPALNVFHTSDNKEEAKRVLDVFFGDNE